MLLMCLNFHHHFQCQSVCVCVYNAASNRIITNFFIHLFIFKNFHQSKIVQPTDRPKLSTLKWKKNHLVFCCCFLQCKFFFFDFFIGTFSQQRHWQWQQQQWLNEWILIMNIFFLIKKFTIHSVRKLWLFTQNKFQFHRFIITGIELKFFSFRTIIQLLVIIICSTIYLFIFYSNYSSDEIEREIEKKNPIILIDFVVSASIYSRCVCAFVTIIITIFF